MYIIGKAIFDPHLLSQGLLLSSLLTVFLGSSFSRWWMRSTQKSRLFTSLESANVNGLPQIARNCFVFYDLWGLFQ